MTIYHIAFPYFIYAARVRNTYEHFDTHACLSRHACVPTHGHARAHDDDDDDDHDNDDEMMMVMFLMGMMMRTHARLPTHG